MSDIKYNNRQARILAWLLFFMSLISIESRAQDFFFDRYSLGSQKVYDILQDKNGFIWIGTENGVTKFDGVKFQVFTTRDSLPAGGVRCLFEDNRGKIWFGHHNGGGVSMYDGKRFNKCSFDTIKIAGDVSDITQTGDSMWFATTSDGALMARYPDDNIRNIKAKSYKGKEGLSYEVTGTYVLKDGTLICNVNGTLRRLDKKEGTFIGYRMPNMTRYFETSCMLEDQKGNLWFGTFRGGVYRYLMDKSEMVFYDLISLGLSSNTVTCLTEDSHGNVWMGTYSGAIALFDGEKFRKFDESNGFRDADIISDIIEDKEGNVLISDHKAGLSIYKGDAFITLNNKELIPDPNISALFEEANGSLWLGTSAGIIKYSPVSGEKSELFKKEKGLNFKDICIKETVPGEIWITFNSGADPKIGMYDLKKGRFEINEEINAEIYGTSNALESDNNNNLWIASSRGVLICDFKNQRYRSINSMGGLVSGIETLYCDPEGVMWIGAETIASYAGGIIKYSSNDSVNYSDNDFKPVGALSGIIPTALVMDNEGILWIGTKEKLLAFRNDSIVATYTKDDGLLADKINLLVTGDDGSIFVGTDMGLNRLFPKTRRIHSFTERNGFPGVMTNQGAVYKTTSGEIWFGTANGATRLDPKKLSNSEQQPVPHILDLKVKGISYEMRDGMKLKYSERWIYFDYFCISLENPEAVKYKVKLDGADNDWLLTDQTFKDYSSRPPGKYKFMVMACNSRGIWNEEPVTFSFTIKPPFYRTKLSMSIILIALVILVVAYIKMREQNLKKEKKILEEKVEERTAEVVQKSIEIEEKNKDITASIRYAERIQQAMLPRENTFKETFVLFMPKDIVSGDFYWMYDNGDWQFIAAVDCTGHGVPGAFMSIIGHNALNKIVREYGLTRPAAIVDQLNIEVTKSLLQRHEKAVTDGMDIALIAFNRKDFTLEFSGAYSPLYLVRKGELFTYKGDRFPIGMTSKEEKKSFTNQIVDIKPGDMLYMCSDGYADQFGSTDGKKYKSGNVKKLLSEIWDLPICTQKDRLEKEILDWKGERAQVDDILFIGTKIPEI